MKSVDLRDPSERAPGLRRSAAARRVGQAAGPNPRSTIQIIGARPAGVSDLYHLLVRGSWLRLLGLFLGAYLCVNAVFAVAFLLAGGVVNARPGSFADAFFFSVQTLGTLGYGYMYPAGLGAHLLVTAETLVGMMSMAVMTGLVFAKFSRPRARLLFSEVAVISLRNGIPTLVIRVANERSNYVVEATMRVAMLRNEVTEEGERLRRTYDLPLMRSTTPAFVLTWQGMHQVKPDSPLHGLTRESMREQGAELLVSVAGMDETTAQLIHGRHAYTADQIRWGERLADVLVTLPDGRRALDYRRFHQTVPDPTPAAIPPVPQVP